MTAVFGAAFYRAVVLALLTGAVTVLTARQQDQSWEQALVAGGIILFTTIIARAGFEGSYDSHRADTGNMNAGDVPMASKQYDVVEAPAAAADTPAVA